MPNPLDREWLPDEERMRSTTAWILQREPWFVRIAPAVILVFVVALGVWTARAKVSVYEGTSVDVEAHRSAQGGDTLQVRLASDSSVPLEAGASVIVASIEDGAGQTKSRASVVRVDRFVDAGRSAVVATLVAPHGSFSVTSGRATVRVNVGQRPLFSQFLAIARSGGKSS